MIPMCFKPGSKQDIPKRSAGISFKMECGRSMPHTRTRFKESEAIQSEYISVGLNQRPNCLSVQALYHAGRPQLVAFGASRAVCLANCENDGDLRIYRTLAGHADIVTSVAWIPSFKGPNVGYFETLLLSASLDGCIKLWSAGTEESLEVSSWMLPSAAPIIAVHGCYLSEKEDEVVVGVASHGNVFLWHLVLKEENCWLPTTTEPISISRGSDLCLALRVITLSTPSGTPPLLLALIGMSTGRLEVWSTAHTDSWATPMLSVSLKGHTDWVVALDCLLMYPNYTRIGTDAQQSVTHALVSTGSQDNYIRVWHLQLISADVTEEKGVLLDLPDAVKLRCKVSARLECVLAGHGNWVTGVAWSPVSWQPDSCPELLSCSRDKSLIIWQPSQPPLATTTSSKGADMWSERARFGSMGGNQLGYMACAWGNYNSHVYGHSFSGSLCSWHCDEDSSLEPGTTLTGHSGPVVDLSWARPTFGGLSLVKEDGEGFSEGQMPMYLLTASRDQTVRLHGIFCTCGFGCSPPAYIWRELARPQVHGYDMNAVACLDAFHYVSAGDEKVVRVFAATTDFVDRYLDNETLARHPTLTSDLCAGAVQPALGLSNQAAATEEESEMVNIINPLYPPTEDVLGESTLWTETNKLYGHSYEVFCLAAHPKGSLVASACKATKEEFAKIFLWRTDNWQTLQQLSFHQLTVTQLRFDNSGCRLLSVSRDRQWAVWKASDTVGSGDHPNYTLHQKSPAKGGHARIIWSCAWTIDDKYFLTGSRDKRIILWDGETGSPVGPPHTLFEAVTALAIAPVATDYLTAVGFEHGALQLVKLTSSTCTPLIMLPLDWSHMGMTVRQLAFFPVNSQTVQLASAGEDGMVRIFSIYLNNLLQDGAHNYTPGP